MKLRWDVDGATVVELELGGFGKKSLTVNGQDVPIDLSLRRKGEHEFALPGGRTGRITIKPQFATSPVVELRVDGQLQVPTGKTPPKCASCGADVKPNDRYCSACGHPAPPPEHYQHQKNVREATTAIWILAALFPISGVVAFFIQRSQVAAVLSKLDTMSSDTVIPKTINGVTYTVGELRAQINWEVWSVLVINFILGAVMVGLALWGRRAPLAAAIVAAATYATVIVASAIVDPATIAQGLYMKIIIVLFLFRGIQGGLALRGTAP